MCESFIFIFNKRIRLWMTQMIAIWIPSVIILHFFFSLCSVWEDTSKTDSSTACCKKKRERGSPLHMCAHSKTAVSLPNPPCLVPSELCSFLLHVRLFMAPTAVVSPYHKTKKWFRSWLWSWKLHFFGNRWQYWKSATYVLLKKDSHLLLICKSSLTIWTTTTSSLLSFWC